MGLLTDNERDEVKRWFADLPDAPRTDVIRTLLLAGLSQDLQTRIDTSDNPTINIINIVDGGDDPALALPPASGWPIFIILRNAINYLSNNRRWAEDREALQALLTRLEDRVLPTPLPTQRSSASGSGRTTPATFPARDPILSKEELTSRQLQQLNNALVDAFATRKDLERMVRFQLDLRLDLITTSGNLIQTVFELVEWSSREGRLAELVMAARTQNPGNVALRNFAEEIGLAPATPPQAEVESIIQRVKMPYNLDITTWLRGAQAREAAVCRVTTGDDTSSYLFTGFLVGPDIMMTCYHTFSYVFDGRHDPASVRLRFDYMEVQTNDGTKVSEGVEYHLAATDWLIAHSPMDALDYVLLRVDGRPGDDPVGGQPGAPPRRWLDPAATHIFRHGDPLYIIHHPGGGPRKVAVFDEAVIKVNSDQTRVTYRIDTEAGASGSPCFSADWNLVAMQRAWSADGFGEGIPMSAIVANLSKKGLKASLFDLPPGQNRSDGSP